MFKGISPEAGVGWKVDCCACGVWDNLLTGPGLGTDAVAGDGATEATEVFDVGVVPSLSDFGAGG